MIGFQAGTQEGNGDRLELAGSVDTSKGWADILQRGGRNEAAKETRRLVVHVVQNCTTIHRISIDLYYILYYKSIT